MTPAQMADAIETYAEWCGGVHDDCCPEDDTCACESKWINDGITAAVNYLRSAPLLRSPEPLVKALEADCCTDSDCCERLTPYSASHFGCHQKFSTYEEMASHVRKHHPSALSSRAPSVEVERVCRCGHSEGAHDGVGYSENIALRDMCTEKDCTCINFREDSRAPSVDGDPR